MESDRRMILLKLTLARNCYHSKYVLSHLDIAG